MNLTQFQTLSKRTMPFGGEPANQVEFENMLGNYAMGLVGEVLEFVIADATGTEDEANKEAGDTLHYCVGLLSCMGEKIDFERLYEIDTDQIKLTQSWSDILEISKKNIYHRHDLARFKLIDAVHIVIKSFMDTYDKENLSNVLQMNIDKLKTRYPDKFSVEDSIKRVDING